MLGLVSSCGDSVDGLGEHGEGGGEDTGATATTGMPRMDAGGETDDTDDTGDPDPCTKLDLLFVIDNTLGNQVIAQQAEMLIKILAGTVEANWDDFHVGVVRTNDSAGACRKTGSLSNRPDPMAAECTAAAGNYASHDDAGSLSEVIECLANLSSAEVPDAAPKVALAAARGMSGSGVAAFDAGFDAIQTDCNAGFLRPDARHVLVIIASEDDVAPDGSPGEPADWYAWLSGYESGDGLVVFNVLPRDDMECAQGAANRLVEWVGMFSETSDHDWCGVDPIGFFGALTAELEGGCGA